MNPGPELDELVLSKVFGKTKAEVGYLHNFSGEKNAAFKVIEQMDKLDFICISRFVVREKKYKVRFEQYYPTPADKSGEAETNEFCLSICLSALRALGVEI